MGEWDELKRAMEGHSHGPWDEGPVDPHEKVPIPVLNTVGQVAAVMLSGEEKLDERNQAVFARAFSAGAKWRQDGCPGVQGVLAIALEENLENPDLKRVLLKISRIAKEKIDAGDMDATLTEDEHEMLTHLRECAGCENKRYHR